MADEAFALSPISARAALPSEADYDAIREAFMETARGRWFLSEYAKRNRNADTHLVLDAVARIETTMAAQKQPPATGLLESLGPIRLILADIKTSAAAAMTSPNAEDIFTAARNGARIVREIAWTLRECGADIRICDLLDTQVKAIDAGQQQAASNDSREAVMASFDLLMQRIEGLAIGDTAVTPPAGTATAAKPSEPAPLAPDTAAAEPHHTEAEAALAPGSIATNEPVQASAYIEPQTTAAPQHPDDAVEAAAEEPAERFDTVATAGIEAQADEAEAAANDTTTQDDLTTQEFAAQDMAVLDMVALEMAEPDIVEPEELEVGGDTAIAPDDVPAAQDDAPRHEVEVAAQNEPEVEVSLAPEPEPLSNPSLGAALIANGVLAGPKGPGSDPLAPIRRMSQVEKVAFFS